MIDNNRVHAKCSASMASPSAGTNRLEATIVAKPTVPETTQHMHAAPEPAADAAAKPDETHAPHADDEAHSSHAVSVTHAEEPAESMLPPAAKPAPKAAAAIYSTSGRATSSTAGKAAGSKGKSGSGRGVALAALPLLALGAAGVWLLRKWRASHGTPARPTSSAAIKGKRALSSPTRPKPKSAKRDSTKSASAAAKDAAADATAESGGQPAVAEEPAVAIAPDTFEILTKELSLLPPPAPPPPMAPPPLAGMVGPHVVPAPVRLCLPWQPCGRCACAVFIGPATFACLDVSCANAATLLFARCNRMTNPVNQDNW